MMSTYKISSELSVGYLDFTMLLVAYVTYFTHSTRCCLHKELKMHEIVIIRFHCIVWELLETFRRSHD